jgi:hypothetical protein
MTSHNTSVAIDGDRVTFDEISLLIKREVLSPLIPGPHITPAKLLSFNDDTVSRMLKNTKINRDRLKLLENFSYSLP